MCMEDVCALRNRETKTVLGAIFDLVSAYGFLCVGLITRFAVDRDRRADGHVTQILLDTCIG